MVGDRFSGKPTTFSATSDFAAHGVDVAHGVGSGDGAVRVRVVNDGREEVERQHDREVVTDAIDRGVVEPVEAEEQVRVLFGPEGFGQGAQDLRQEGDARLARSAGAGGEGGQADLFSRHRCSFRLRVESGRICIASCDYTTAFIEATGERKRAAGNLFGDGALYRVTVDQSSPQD